MEFAFGEGGKDLKSNVTEAYKFYNGEVTLIYDVTEHRYFKVSGKDLIPQDGVTTIIHIIDKSDALIPWAAKKVAEKAVLIAPFDSNGEIHMDRAAFEALMQTAKTAPRDLLEEAGDVGHAAHACIEKYIKGLMIGVPYHYFNGKELKQDERVDNCFFAALAWMNAHNVRWICTEKKIYSRKYSYAGTMDGKAYVDSCNDPKCCKHVFKDRLSVIDWKSSNYLYVEYLLQTSAYAAAEMEETGEEITDRWVIRLGKTDGEFEPWHLEQDQFEQDFTAFLECLDLYRSMELIRDGVKGRKDEIKLIVKEEKAAAKAKLIEEKRLLKEQEKELKKLEKATKAASVAAKKKAKAKPAVACMDPNTKINIRKIYVDNNPEI